MADKQIPAVSNTGDTIEPAKENTASIPATGERGEKAAQFLAQHGQVTFDYEEEKHVLQRIDRRILPLILGAYFFQQLDKSTLSYTSIFGLIEDANLKGTEYSWLGSILYLAQLVMQPLAAFILVKLPYGKVTGIAIIGWGSCAAIMASCTNFKSLAALRFLLGTFESMIAPSCVAVTQMWWRRSEQTLRNSYWNAMNGVTFIVGSLITYGLGHIKSSKIYTYQVIFVFCGCLTVLFGLTFILLMPDSPMEAKYLNEREKIIAIERLRANQMGVASRKWRWDHVLETFMDIKTWLWFILTIAISGGISSFGNLIIKSFGFSSFTAILFSLPTGCVQIVSIIGSAYLSTRFARKGLIITCLSCLPATGAIIMLTVPRENKGVLLFGYYLVQCLGAITPMIFTWSAQNTGGDTKKKTSSGMVFVGMCTGNVIGPLLYSTEQAPTYRPGLIANLIMFVLVGAMGLLIPLYLMLLNRRHAQMREQLGKSAVIIDESMLRKKNMGSSKQAELEQNEHAETHKLEDDNGLQDVSDLKNEDFIYVY
ncbi:major facilitator superfamily domain-containing protein [Pseudomassariella vexata]|uniref:Major facilitator superfamily domain-containing protein n=1 Tax=Pseudomassariella vexata TaxID=1141098 RepID=A0A1Y2EF82_9PEZI|nr:major facilitator superfamily domain-containing protein [Pseudomassariella vexata]ORY70209.1 major facilitator superfamily domain-containing protein [Pseudomassariella vexata]